MSKLKYIFFLLLILVGSKIAFAANATASCGANKSCQDGYYCSGAIGEAESGVCLPSSVSISICKFTQYLQSDILKYFMLFASVFAGIYFYIGKFALVTFAQIIIGIAIMLSAQQLVIIGTGSNKGLCSISDATDCLNKTTGNKIQGNTTEVKNLAPTEISDNKYIPKGSDGKCNSLDCVKAMCTSYSSKSVQINANDQAQGNKTVCTKNTKQDEVMNAKAGTFTPKGCDEMDGGKEITCTPVISPLKRDYFTCTNACTNTIFSAEAPSSWNISSCKELILKQISYK